MDNPIITINKNEILQYKTEGANLVLKKNAEEQLIKLLDLKDFIDQTIEEVKKMIADSGKTAIGADFKGVIGKHIKAIYRFYGEKYQTSNPDFIKQVVIERTDSKKIEAYLEETGVLPPQTSEKERTEKLVLTRNEK